MALSPTTLFISVWAPTVSRLNRTEGKEERHGERGRGRRRGREVSDGNDSNLRQEADASDRKQNHADETEDTVGDMTQNPNHCLMDAEICHTLTLRGDRLGTVFFFFLTGNRVLALKVSKTAALL